MELSSDEEFVLADSSSDNDSDVENLLANHRQQMLVVVMAIKEYEDRRGSQRRGSKVGRLCIPRNRHLSNELLMRDYFAQRPTYPANLFRRRYRMRRFLVVKIVEACESNSRYFTRRRNAAGLLGFSAYQKISATMRVIAYGIVADYANEYLRIGEDTTIESVRRFLMSIFVLVKILQ
ncbi:Cell division cycle 5-like protein [Hordeum vulgare]|nr:Cell division cycle 5-like protein [Hordeum vulgare]